MGWDTIYPNRKWIYILNYSPHQETWPGRNVTKDGWMNRLHPRQHGGAEGMVVALQPQGPWFDSELGLLSVWGFLLSSYIPKPLATLNCPRCECLCAWSVAVVYSHPDQHKEKRLSLNIVLLQLLNLHRSIHAVYSVHK